MEVAQLYRKDSPMGSERRKARRLPAQSGGNSIHGRAPPATPTSAGNEGRRRRSRRVRPPPPAAASFIVINDSDDEAGHGTGEARSLRAVFSGYDDSTKDSMATRSSSRSPVQSNEESMASSGSKPNVIGNRDESQMDIPVGSPSVNLELISDSASSTSSSRRTTHEWDDHSSCKEIEYAGEGPLVEEAPRLDPIRASCVARRTRSQIGFLARFSYTRFFNDKVLDEEVEGAGKREAEEAADYSNPEICIATDTEDETQDTRAAQEKPAFAQCENPVCPEVDAKKINGVPFTASNVCGNDVDEPIKEFEFVLTSSDSDGEDELYLGSLDKPNPAKRIMNMDGKDVCREPKRRNISKRKRECVLNDDALYKLLMDLFFSNKDKLPEEHSTEKENDHHNDGAAGVAEDYPLLFSFEDEVPIFVEKSTDMEMLDELWNEFEFALQSVNVGSYDKDELHENYLCSEGEHHFVLDEQIGIICKFCSFVRLQMKYVLPSLDFPVLFLTWTSQQALDLVGYDELLSCSATGFFRSRKQHC